MAKKNSSLLLFGVIYGQITSAVIVVTVVVYGLGSQRGEEICSSIGLGLLACRTLAAILILTVFGLSGILSVWGLKRGAR